MLISMIMADKGFAKTGKTLSPSQFITWYEEENASRISAEMGSVPFMMEFGAEMLIWLP